jgi:hypothetical protein
VPSTTPFRFPKGGELRTLHDAGNFIAKLPKREHDALECQAAIRAVDARYRMRRPDAARADWRHARGASASRARTDAAQEQAPDHPMTRAWIAALRRRDALGALGCSVGPVTFRFHVRRRQTHVNVRRGFINVVLEIGGFLNEPSPQMRIRDRFGEI